MKLYECMFVFDNTAAHEWTAVETEVKRLFDRIEAKQHVCVKFDERRLAFEMDGRKRGTYVLTYFDADPEKITDLERDGRLSEMVLRMLVMRPKDLTEERLAELKAHPPEKALSPSTEGRRGDRDDRGGRFGDRDRGDRDRGDRDRGDRDRGDRDRGGRFGDRDRGDRDRGGRGEGGGEFRGESGGGAGAPAGDQG